MTMKRKYKVIGTIIVVFVLLQFIPVERPEVISSNPDDFLSEVKVSDSIGQLIKSSCYDCHSNETHYPWYSYVFPSSLLVARDTREGRKELNFSDWGSMNKLKKFQHLNKMEEEIESGEMPMKIYILMHPKAGLTSDEKASLLQWIDTYRNELFN